MPFFFWLSKSPTRSLQLEQYHPKKSTKLLKQRVSQSSLVAASRLKAALEPAATMSGQELTPYVTITRDISAPIDRLWDLIAGFRAERTRHPVCLELFVTGFGVGSVRILHYEFVDLPQKYERYVFPENMTAVCADKHSMTFRIRRPNYPDMVALGITALEPLVPTGHLLFGALKALFCRGNIGSCCARI